MRFVNGKLRDMKIMITIKPNSAWRPRRVDAELDPGGRVKELVWKSLDTVRARLATERARYK